jgi:co-chaperonin GroES (HSP10)
VPLHNNLVVEPFQLGEISRGGLLIPQVAKASTPYRFAKVLEVGPGRYAADGRLIPVTPQIGDVVAYSKNQGVLFPLDDHDGNEHEVLLINEQFLIGIVKDLPMQSQISGLDGRLLQMNPQSRAMADSSVANFDQIARARRDGMIDTQGNYLDDLASADDADRRNEGD